MPQPTVPPPVAAVIAVVVRDDRALLVQRANPPDAGRWGFPGGKIDGGETLATAALRELEEETGVRAEAGPVLTALDAFERADDGTVRRHFLLVAVLCHWLAGEPVAADDALDARWMPVEALDDEPRNADALALCADVAALARQAVAVADGGGRSGGRAGPQAGC